MDNLEQYAKRLWDAAMSDYKLETNQFNQEVREVLTEFANLRQKPYVWFREWLKTTPINPWPSDFQQMQIVALLEQYRTGEPCSAATMDPMFDPPCDHGNATQGTSFQMLSGSKNRVSEFEVKIVQFDELPPEIDKTSLSNNGSGAEWADYLLIYHNGKLIRWESSAMEPEDVRFTRDLRWVSEALEEAYEYGLEDA